ncbi:MAG: bestrophin family protein [Oligoflexales bacterium]
MASTTSISKIHTPAAVVEAKISNQAEDRNFLKTALAWNGSITPKILPRVLTASAYSCCIVILTYKFPDITLAIEPFEYSGVVLGLLLVARVNAGMQRWWEARKIWGSIVNQSRNLAIIAQQYSERNNPYIAPLLNWIAIWPYTMRQHLRGENKVEIAKKHIGIDETNKLTESGHMPFYVGTAIAGLLKSLRSQGLDDFAFQRAERERALLIDAIGGCERIRSTPIPLVLAIKTRRFIFLFLLLLPFALGTKVPWLAPIIMILTAYPLLSLDQIGIELQNPFAQKNLSHLPLSQICANIERNILNLPKIDADIRSK